MLMFATVAGLVGFYLYVSDTSQWSETELRDAVHEAARDLEAQPQRVHLGYESMIRDAIRATGEGPGYDLDISPSPTEDNFEISAAFLSETFCMRLTPPEPPRTWGTTDTVSLTVRVSEGRC
nr:hypothetical protein [Streptomyces sp. R301]